MATTDPELIASWWRLVPFNIATHLTGVVVIDVDQADDLGALAPFGPWPTTPTQRTGRGWHLFFRVPPGGMPSLVKPIPGVSIETKAEGASLTLAPSRHQSGARYTWLPGRDPFSCPLAELPHAFRTHLERIAARVTAARASRPALDPHSPAAVAKLIAHRARHAQGASQGLARGAYGVRRTLEEAGAAASVVKMAVRAWWHWHGETPRA